MNRMLGLRILLLWHAALVVWGACNCRPQLFSRQGRLKRSIK